MAEIISFPQRMRFTAIRTFDAANGIGSVVAVLWAPANSNRNSNGQRHEHDGHPTLAELSPEAAQPIATVSSNPATARDCKDENRITHGHR